MNKELFHLFYCKGLLPWLPAVVADVPHPNFFSGFLIFRDFCLGHCCVLLSFHPLLPFSLRIYPICEIPTYTQSYTTDMLFRATTRLARTASTAAAAAPAKRCIRTQYRTFATTQPALAKEDVEGARSARLTAFIEQIRSNEKVHTQLRSVQLVIASKIGNTGAQPSLMQQMQLLSDKEVRAEMLKLSEIMKQENVNISKEDVGFLMQCLKAQMDEEK